MAELQSTGQEQREINVCILFVRSFVCLLACTQLAFSSLIQEPLPKEWRHPQWAVSSQINELN